MLDNPAVFRALDQTFHSTAIDHAEPLPAGLSTDLIYRITVKGSPYILRIMTRIDERMDPARIFACMRAASGAGIAAPLRYSSPEDSCWFPRPFISRLILRAAFRAETT